MKIINLALNTLLALIVIGAGVFLLVPRLGLIHPYEIKIVRSGSMAPAIPTGSVVLIQPASEYKVGDVITFGLDTPTSVPTTHRIVSLKSENGVTYAHTKGDANEDIDPSETPSSKIIGRVILALPSVGYILAFSKTKPGFASMVLIPALLVICYEFISIIKEVKLLKKRKRDERAVRDLAEESHEVYFDIESPCGWRERTVI